MRAGLYHEHEGGRKIKIWVREEERFIDLGSRVDTVLPREHVIFLVYVSWWGQTLPLSSFVNISFTFFSD